MFPETEKLLLLEKELCTKLDSLNFESEVEYIYNPLLYAQDLHVKFYQKYFENSTKQILFLGMNPGPWGMCQTGIVFGEITFVKEWLKIIGTVQKPPKEHPKKKITGLQCHRSEISGKKFWELVKKLCDSPENFFKHSFIYNYCPLAFMNSSGKNITPPEIKDPNTQKLLNNICDDILIKIIKIFQVKVVIGIGKYAEKSAIKALKSNKVTNVKLKSWIPCKAPLISMNKETKVLSIPHPSPRNAKNLANWEYVTIGKLQENNLIQYLTEKSEFINKNYGK